MKNITNITNIIFLFIVYFLFIYSVLSFLEWTLHYYFMHENIKINKIIKMKNVHIEHHKETYLDQTLPPDYIEEGLPFNFFDIEIIFISIVILFSAFLFWNYFPNFKNNFSIITIMIITTLIIFIYSWCWSSIHSNYHNVYIECNKPLKNNKNITIYSPMQFFVPDTTSFIYKYLFWYHTLHHLNKGKSKGNYNVLTPLFDFVFGTYTNKVDNTLHFSLNEPKTKQEIWLKQHIIFEIRILDNNIIQYKEPDSNVWKYFPNNT